MITVKPRTSQTRGEEKGYILWRSRDLREVLVSRAVASEPNPSAEIWLSFKKEGEGMKDEETPLQQAAGHSEKSKWRSLTRKFELSQNQRCGNSWSQ